MIEIPSLPRMGRRADQDELGTVGEDLTADGPVDRLPPRRVFSDMGDDIRFGRDLAVAQRTGELDDPPVAFARPEALAVAPPGVEVPRPKLTGDGIPADPLGSRHGGPALDLDGVIPEQEILVFRPSAGSEDDRRVALVDPLADHPVQFLEP